MLRKVGGTAAILFGGAAVGQLAAVAVSPLLTRLYTPNDFGEFGVYVSLLYSFVAVATGRYETAIPIERLEASARLLVALSLRLVLVSAVISLILVAVSQSFWPGLPAVLWLLPLGILLAGSYNVIARLALRHQLHSAIARTRVAQGAGGAALQAFLGFTNVASIGLVAGQILALSYGTTRLAKSLGYVPWKVPSGKRAWMLLRKNVSFPAFEGPASLCVIGNAHGPTLIFAAAFSLQVAGAYALIQRVVGGPLGMFSNALAGSFSSLIRELGHVGTGAIVKILCLLHPLLAAVFSIISVLVYLLIGRIFGDAWEPSRLIAMWLSLFFGQKFVFDAAYSLLALRRRQRESLNAQVGILIVRGLPLMYGLLLLAPVDTIALFSFSSAFAYSCAFLYTKKVLIGRLVFSDVLCLADTSAGFVVVTAFTVSLDGHSFFLQSAAGLWLLIRSALSTKELLGYRNARIH